MRLPAVAIVTAFASGIALGFWPVIAKYATAPGFLRATVIAATLFIIIAVVGVLKSRLGFSWGLSLAAWLLLGISGAGISQRPEPPTYVLNLINSRTIDLHTRTAMARHAARRAGYVSLGNFLRHCFDEC